MAVHAAVAPTRELVVLGGGISGLSLAYFLRQALRQLPQSHPHRDSTRIRVLEASADTGGWVRTAQTDNFLFEEGPRGFRPSRNGAEMLRLVEQLQLERELRVVDAAAKSRYVLRNGTVEKLPSSLLEVLQWPLTPAVVRAGIRELWTPRRTLDADESIYAFVARRFSPLVAEQLLDPVASGIFGGDIRHLSIRACFKLLYDMEQSHGSLVRAMLFSKSAKHEFLLDGTHKSEFVTQHEAAMSVSFAAGMATLIEALENALANDPLTELHCDARVTALAPTPPTAASTATAFKITLDRNGDRNEQLTASHVFSTLPAFALAPIVLKSLPQLTTALDTIDFVDMGVVHLGFDSNDVLKHDGFGYLVPSNEREQVLGVVFDSNAFPHQTKSPSEAAKRPQTRLSVMCGGAHFPAIAELSTDAVTALARDAVARHLGITRTPDYERAIVLRKCIPQYHVGFPQTLARIEQALVPGMFLGGNSFYGVGLADSVTRSKELALAFVETLK